MATFQITITSSAEAIASPHHAALKSTIQAASANLVDFWPTEPEHGQLSIHIVDGAKVVTTYSREGRARPVQRIEFGVDALTLGPGREFREIIKDDLPIVLHLLGHETFHLTQTERILACGGHEALHSSGFAQGLHPTMDEAWKEAALALADAYPNRGAMIAPIAKASDIVSELRADIRGLNVLKRAKQDWEAYAAVLQFVRRSEEADPQNYQIADAMASLVTARLPTEIAALPRLWSIAFDQLAALSLPGEINKLIQLAKPKLNLDGSPQKPIRPR